MSFEADLYSHLIGVAGISALLGERIYPELAPTNAILPHVTLQTIIANHEHTESGGGGMCNKLIQISVWAATSVSREEVAEAIRNGIDGSTQANWGSTTISSVILDNELNTFDPPDDGSEQGTFSRKMDFRIGYYESVPSLA